jgi:hypothetical protein
VQLLSPAPADKIESNFLWLCLALGVALSSGGANCGAAAAGIDFRLILQWFYRQ